MIHAHFDFQNPDYGAVFAERVERLQRIRADKSGRLLACLKAFYRDNPVNFIEDWGCTYDPRNADIDLPTTIPFVLFPKQREWVAWTLNQWQTRQPGLTEKSRDCGISWLAVSLSVTLCLFREGMQIGFGSSKEEGVDSSKSPKALFWKARKFIELLPVEFRNGWQRSDATHMRIHFPATDSVMVGEAGDNIGRGDRAALYFVDESTAIERPQLIEDSLSATTNCRIDISTPRGMANPFAQKRHDPEWIKRGRIFIFDWRDDPRKSEEWYEWQKINLNPVTLAQEVDRNYSASVVGIVIPNTWVQSCVDLHIKLGFEATGMRRGALDVADEGLDLNAFCAGHGVLVQHVTAWSGKGDDIFGTTETAFTMCTVLGLEGFDYDADGLGAGVRGDARVLNEKRAHKLDVQPFRGSGEVVDKKKPIETAAPRTEKKQPGEVVRLNEDYYANAKAQGWFSLRARFQRGHRALQLHREGKNWREAYEPDDLISINSKMPELSTLTSQLSQAVYKQSLAGKMLIDKAPADTRSPNHADAVMIRYAPRKPRGRYNLDAFGT